MRRRQFLLGGVALGAGAAGGRLLGPSESSEAAAVPEVERGLDARVPFEGEHQAGVIDPRPLRAVFASFDAIAGSRDELAAGLQALSERARTLTGGGLALLGAPGAGPTPDSGTLGPRVRPDGLTVTIGFGASLFDRRYGLARAKPARLEPMPVFPDDALVAGETHGDVLLQICANTDETVLHALRDLMRATRGVLAARWKVEGFLPDPGRESGAGRNHLGFKDGTANPDVKDRALMDRLVWTREGGTYAVVRTIRMRVEFWDRVALSEQELMIGRDKARGAPLGLRGEQDDPGYANDPDGKRIPLDAHIRLARPRTPQTEDERILRRGYNYSRGIDEAGQLDMGLIFAAYQRDPARQFAKVQRRLAGEPLVDYVVPTGGGYFYMPPGASDSRDWVGSGLFA
jgi:deferrochelatase/peroxidase EfeB